MPRVRIGMPVYNGQKYVGASIESLLAQTYRDFEIVVVDNASTDETGAICRALAARDPRVRYHRNDRNIGGGPNQSRAFELAAGAPYFKWAAHDDIHGPRFLETCMAALDRDSGLVVAFTGVDFVDADGKTLRTRTFTLPLDAPDPLVRYESILPEYDCLEIFGVMRRDAMERIPVIGHYVNADGVLLANMALQGRFHVAPDVQFYNRRHATQAGTRHERDMHGWAVWWNPDYAGRPVYPRYRRLGELWRGLFLAPLPLADRARCTVALLRWTRSRLSGLRQDPVYPKADVPSPPSPSPSSPPSPSSSSSPSSSPIAEPHA